MIKSKEFKETLRSAVNLPNINVGYYDPTKQLKDSKPLLQLTADPDKPDDNNKDDLDEHTNESVETNNKESNQIQLTLKNQLNYLVETMRTLRDENDKLRVECGNLEDVLKKQKEDFFRQVESYKDYSMKYTLKAQDLHTVDERYFELKKKYNFYHYQDNKDKDKLLAELKKEKSDQENREKEIIEYWRSELNNLREDNNQL